MPANDEEWLRAAVVSEPFVERNRAAVDDESRGLSTTQHPRPNRQEQEIASAALRVAYDLG